MTAFYVPLTLFLAAVFAVSAVGKMLSPDRGRAGFEALRIRIPQPEYAAMALIAVEGSVAVALACTTGWWFVGASAAASALSIALLVVVVRAHRLGATDDCGCFGEWLPASIGPRLVLRNAILVVISLAVFLSAVLVDALTGEPLGIPHAFAAAPGSVTALGAMTALLLVTLTTWATARATIAARTPRFTPGGGAVLLPATSEVLDLLAGGPRARLLVFVSPGCHACETVLATLRAIDPPMGALAEVYIVQRVVHGTLAAAPEHPLPSSAVFALDVGGSLGGVLEIGHARPVAALIHSDGTQAGPLAVGGVETGILIDSIVSLSRVPSR